MRKYKEVWQANNLGKTRPSALREVERSWAEKARKYGQDHTEKSPQKYIGELEFI